MPSSLNTADLKDCPYCLAEIPSQAKKCSHCGEWIIKGSVNSGKLCYFYSKILAILNVIGICGIVIEWAKSDYGDLNYNIGKTLSIVLCMIFAVGFWRFESTKSKWPFIVTTISSIMVSVYLVYLAVAGTTGYVFMREDGRALFWVYVAASVVFSIISIFSTIQAHKISELNQNFELSMTKTITVKSVIFSIIAIVIFLAFCMSLIIFPIWINMAVVLAFAVVVMVRKAKKEK